jgi:hypothetical protein
LAPSPTATVCSSGICSSAAICRSTAAVRARGGAGAHPPPPARAGGGRRPGRPPGRPPRRGAGADGKEAITRYRTLATGSTTVSEVALLGCELLTGRTHQIRVHLTRLGHPVVGDPTYGPRPKLAAALGLARPFLHAAALSFVHPVTGEDVALVEPLPDALVGALDRAGIARDDALPWRG